MPNYHLLVKKVANIVNVWIENWIKCLKWTLGFIFIVVALFYQLMHNKLLYFNVNYFGWMGNNPWSFVTSIMEV